MVLTFHLVHYDVWGPSLVSSKDGHHYFDTFIDYYFHVGWAFLPKSQCEVFGISQAFYEETKNYFDTSLKILRFDNAFEYTLLAF